MGRAKPDDSETLRRPTPAGGEDASRQRPISSRPRAPQPDLVGRRLLHFHVVEELGRGGMGIVYRAVDEKLRRPVALKVLNDRYVADERNREMLFREARSAAAVAHPNIAAIHDVLEAEGHAFIAMELVRGKTLRDHIAAGPIDLPAALSYAREIALALAAAHEVGVVHRDLKAENVMIAERGHVKVLDFGLAKIAYESEPVASPSEAEADTSALGLAPTLLQSHGSTAAGHVMGTPAYMSPEQARGEPVDARTDVFAFGVLLYEMATGSQPFERRSGDPRDWGGSGSGDWRQRRPLRAARRGVPRAVERIVVRCLSLAAQDRYADGAALLAAVEEAARVSRGPWRTALAVAAALAAVGGVALAGRSWRSLPAVVQQDAPPSASPAAAELAAGMQAWRDGSSGSGLRKMQRAMDLDPASAAASLRAALWRDLERFTVVGSVAPDQARAAYVTARSHRGEASEYDRALIDAFEPRFRATPDLDEVERRLRDVAARFPSSGEPLYWLAMTRNDAHDAAGATLAAEDAVAVEPALGTAVLALRAWIAAASTTDRAALLDECLARTPSAADCLGARALLRGNAGDCRLMEEDAHAWVAADPDEPHAYGTLAEALFAENAPLDSVRDAATACTQRSAPDEVAIMGAWNRGAIAMGSGDLRAAETEARAYGDSLGSSPSMSMAFAGTMALVLPAMEAGDRDVVQAATSAFLGRERAWTPGSAREAAMPIAVLGMARLGGVVGRSEYVSERARRIAAVEAKLGSAPESERAFVWIYAWGFGVETAADAREALAALARYPPLQPAHAMKGVGAGLIGHVYALAGDRERAIPYLRRGASTCFMMNSVYSALRSRLELANALVEEGQVEEPRALYGSILERWGRATPRSVSADEARAKLARLAAGAPAR